MPVDVLSVTLRALSFLTLFQAGGIALFLAPRERLPNTERLLRRIGILAALIAAVFLLAEYLLQAGRMSGELGGILDPTLQGIVMRSATSVTLSWQLVGLALVGCGLRGVGVRSAISGVIGVVLVVASFCFVGHTSKDPLRWLLSLVLLGHLSVVIFWYGGLLPLYLVSSHEPPPTAACVLRQFSARAIWLVPALALAGLILATLLLPNLAALRRPYGELLIAKVVG